MRTWSPTLNSGTFFWIPCITGTPFSWWPGRDARGGKKVSTQDPVERCPEGVAIHAPVPHLRNRQHRRLAEFRRVVIMVRDGVAPGVQHREPMPPCRVGGIEGEHRGPEVEKVAAEICPQVPRIRVAGFQLPPVNALCPQQFLQT